MSLKHLILGLLADEPLSGYDIKQRFEYELSHFWTTTQAQIYRTLHSLHELGWLSMDIVEQDASPNKKVYSLSDPGRAELQRWLALPQEDTVNDPFVGQLYFGDHADLNQLLDALRTYTANERARLQALEALAATLPEINDLVDIPQAPLVRRLSLDYGIQILRVEVAWLEQALDYLQQKIETPKL